MAYTRVNWQNLPSTSTPVNATNLNNMDSTIKTNDDKLLGNTAMGDILPTSVTTTGNVTVGGNLGIGGNLENKTMSSTNLNNITTNATYSYDNGSNTYSNAPTTDGVHILNVYNDGGSDWVIQEDYVLRYSSSTVDKYIRLKTPTGWGNWTRIV